MQGLQKQSLGARLFAVSADPPEVSEKFRRQYGLTFPILSDPQLTLAQLLKVPTWSKHLQALRYPKKAFLQPSVFIWDASGKLLFQWRMKPSLWNLFGARKRMTPEEIAARVSALASPS